MPFFGDQAGMARCFGQQFYLVGEGHLIFRTWPGQQVISCFDFFLRQSEGFYKPLMQPLTVSTR
jgi:hypothetical protein